MRRFHFALLALLLSLATQPLVAATYYVGNCRVGSFGTINAAVTTVPAGSTVDVCPGTYPERVVISKALTLQGIFSNNSSQAIITLSSAPTPVPSIYWGVVDAQVQVTAGPVNITNITVDGGAGCLSNDTTVGIYYSSGSSGTVTKVESRNQLCGGIGLMAENGAGVIQSVKFENNNVHDNLYAGIFTCSNQTPSTLTSSISGNVVGGETSWGIMLACDGAGTVTGNIVNGINGSIGVIAESTSTTVSGNTISGGNEGIEVDVATTVASNHISNAATGILLAANGASIKSNLITNSNIGMEFNCHTDTVTGNTVNGAPTGFNNVPAAFAGVNKFDNVPTVRIAGGC